MTIVHFDDIRNAYEIKNELIQKWINYDQKTEVDKTTPYDYLTYFYQSLTMKNPRHPYIYQLLPTEPIYKNKDGITEQGDLYIDKLIYNHYTDYHSFSKIANAIYNRECLNHLLNYIFRVKFNNRHTQTTLLKDAYENLLNTSILTNFRKVNNLENTPLKQKSLYEHVVKYKQTLLDTINEISKTNKTFQNFLTKITNIYISTHNYMEQLYATPYRVDIPNRLILLSQKKNENNQELKNERYLKHINDRIKLRQNKDDILNDITDNIKQDSSITRSVTENRGISIITKLNELKPSNLEPRYVFLGNYKNLSDLFNAIETNKVPLCTGDPDTSCDWKLRHQLL